MSLFDDDFAARQFSQLARDPGVQSGRLASSVTFGTFLPEKLVVEADTYQIPHPHGHMFCLGHDTPGKFGFFFPGEKVELLRGFPITNETRIHFCARFRPPRTAPPSGFAWRFQILIDGVIVETRDLPKQIFGTDASTTWVSMFANISKVTSGSAVFMFRLMFAGPGNALHEVEIPAVYLDSVVLRGDRAALAHFPPFFGNFNPELSAGFTSPIAPLQTQPIDFEMIDFGSDNINQNSLLVRVTVVDGTGMENAEAPAIQAAINAGTPVDAIVGGVFQTGNGWDGFVLDPGNPIDTLKIRMFPLTTLPSRALVQVNIIVANNHGEQSQRVYNLLFADTLAPSIEAVVALTTKTLKVTFGEPVIAENGVDGSATTAGAYALAPQIVIGGTVPAVTPIVVSAVPVDPETGPTGETVATVFELTTDVDLTPGVQYELTATDLDDPSRNEGTSSLVFDPFVPPAPADREFDLYRMLPLMNRQEDTSEDLIRFVRCLQEIVALLLYDVDRWSNVLDIDTAPEQFLDPMLFDLGNPFPFVLTTTQKRKLLGVLVDLYRRKGTARGIIDAIRFFLGIETTITTGTSNSLRLGISKLGVDWILGPGNSYALYSFRVISSVVLTDEQREGIRVIANYMKVAHEHLVEIVEPSGPPTSDPVELGISLLGEDWTLH